MKGWTRTVVTAALAAVVARPALVAAAGAPQPAPTPTPAPYRLDESIVVQGVRAEDRTPVTKTEIGREQIEAASRGQEMPFLLASTPGVNVQSDSGLAAGYAYFNVRGVSQTRLNVTLDELLLTEIDARAEKLGMSRSAFLADAARRALWS